MMVSTTLDRINNGCEKRDVCFYGDVCSYLHDHIEELNALPIHGWDGLIGRLPCDLGCPHCVNN